MQSCSEGIIGGIYLKGKTMITFGSRQFQSIASFYLLLSIKLLPLYVSLSLMKNYLIRMCHLSLYYKHHLMWRTQLSSTRMGTMCKYKSKVNNQKNKQQSFYTLIRLHHIMLLHFFSFWKLVNGIT